MSAIIEDDRTLEQRDTHTWLVIGTDRFLSGRGYAEGGLSYAAWACRPEERHECLDWVEGRSDMLRVREVSEWERRYRPGSACAHLHVYVWDTADRRAIGQVA